jgi:hypothetical protein
MAAGLLQKLDPAGGVGLPNRVNRFPLRVRISMRSASRMIFKNHHY